MTQATRSATEFFSQKSLARLRFAYKLPASMAKISMTPVTVNMPKAMAESLKKKARSKMMSRQLLINLILQRHVDDEFTTRDLLEGGVEQ